MIWEGWLCFGLGWFVGRMVVAANGDCSWASSGHRPTMAGMGGRFFLRSDHLDGNHRKEPYLQWLERLRRRLQRLKGLEKGRYCFKSVGF